jgi:hypothetical protein
MQRALLICLAVSFLVSHQAEGANVHIKSGPAVTTSPTSLQLEACLAGLGNQDIQVSITVTGNATVNCLNPSGVLVPGHNKVPITATATTTIRRTEIKNGNVCFSVRADAPKTVDPLLAGCPNANWTAQVVSVDFTTVSLVVVQGGQVVLNQTYQIRADSRSAKAIISRSIFLKK